MLYALPRCLIPAIATILITSPTPGTAQSTTFTDITDESGTGGPNHFGGHGVQFADVDSDGFSDFYVTMNETGFGDMAELFYRNIDGTLFNEEAAARGIDNFDTGSHGGVFADFDNDGDFDLFNGSYDQNRIYRNNGSGSFQDRTVQAGLPSRLWPTRGVAAFDMDLDGDLDIVAINGFRGSDDPPAERNEFYRNVGGFTFLAANIEPLFSAPAGQGITDVDYDNDGYIDLFAANRSGPVVILRNTGGTGFQTVAPASIGIVHVAGDGISFGDANNDGFLDVLLDNELYLADGDGTFTHRQTLNGPGIPYMGGFADLDNDGDLDVVIPGANFVYWNNGNGVFSASASFALGPVNDPRSVAFSDIDNDGDLDFYYAQKRTFNILVRNNYSGSNRWLKVLLHRASGQIGAFGARIYVYEAGGLDDPERLITWREIRSQDGYLSQSDPRVVLGLGRNDRVDLRAEFPGGERVTLRNVAARQSLEIQECDAGSCEPADTVPPTKPENLDANSISDSEVELQWDASSDASGIAHYTVLRDGEEILDTTATAIVDAGLAPATLYRYRVYAVDNVGLQSERSDAIAVTTRDDETPPTRPEQLTATAVSDARIDLSWAASTDNSGISSYSVVRDGVPIGTTPTTSYADTNLVPDTVYRYVVIANDVAGIASQPSAPTTARTFEDATPPSRPRNLAGTAISDSRIDLTWTASSDNVGVAGYTVYRDAEPVANVGQPGYSDTGLDAETRYRYAVSAFDSLGNESPTSAAVEITTLAAPPPVDTVPPTRPGNLVGTGISDSEIELQWDASSDSSGIAHYTVLRDGEAILDTTATAIVDAGLVPATLYRYRVYAVDNVGLHSELSEEVAVATRDDETPPTTPQQLSATAVSDARIDLSWAASTDNTGIASYSVVRDGVQIGTTPTTNYADTNLTPATDYSYVVIANDLEGNASQASAPATARTLDDATAPSRPRNLAGTAISDSRIDLTWAPSTDNVGVAGYTVFRDAEPVAHVEQPGYSDTGLDAETRYRYTVSAFDSNGNESPASAAVDITTLAAPEPPSPTPPPNPPPNSPPNLPPAQTSGSGSIGVPGLLLLLLGTFNRLRAKRRGGP